MMVNTLYFDSEIQKVPDISKEKVTKEELSLAKNLIKQMTKPFSPEKYKDEYYIKLQKAIKQKVAGNEIVKSKDKKEPVKVINLMDALQRSLVTTGKRKAQ